MDTSSSLSQVSAPSSQSGEDFSQVANSSISNRSICVSSEDRGVLTQYKSSNSSAAVGPPELLQPTLELLRSKEYSKAIKLIQCIGLLGKGADFSNVIQEQHIDLNAKDSDADRGCTLLHWAARETYLEAIKLLLVSQANVNVQDNFYGSTPLHYAALNGNSIVLKLLISSGAIVNAQAKDGSTPLHNAAMAGRVEAIELLLVSKAVINIKDKKGCTPLDYTIQNGQVEAAALLQAAEEQCKAFVS